ncbi:MAG: tetratricopeptide repeat protein [Leptospirales bacterium]|nr:tetratricopeptide repeat protein [Leptospirales bacterium]
MLPARFHGSLLVLLLGAPAIPLAAQNAPAQNQNAAANADVSTPATPASGGQNDSSPGAAELPTQGERVRRLRREQILREGEQSYGYARELADDGMQTRAIEILQDFLDLHADHPRRASALQLLARLQSEAGHIEQAVSALARAYREAPAAETAARAYLQAGRLLAGQGETERARRIFVEVQARDPGSLTSRLAEQELLALDLPPAQRTPAANGNREAPAEAASTPLFPAERTRADDAAQPRGAQPIPANPMPMSAADGGEAAAGRAAQESANNMRSAALDRMGEGIEAMPDEQRAADQN